MGEMSFKEGQVSKAHLKKEHASHQPINRRDAQGVSPLKQTPPCGLSGTYRPSTLDRYSPDPAKSALPGQEPKYPLGARLVPAKLIRKHCSHVPQPRKTKLAPAPTRRNGEPAKRIQLQPQTSTSIPAQSCQHSTAARPCELHRWMYL